MRRAISVRVGSGSTVSTGTEVRSTEATEGPKLTTI
jgi:hypothetical protein